MPNVLFHFTGIAHQTRGSFKPDAESLETLKAILRTGEFQLRLNSREWTVYDDRAPRRPMSFEIPMACFTETPLGFISNHMNTFGHFGLGMRLDWGLRNAAQNVVYCDPDLQNPYGRVLAGVLHLLELRIDANDPDARRSWFRQLVGITEDLRYSDEREWRVIGRIDDPDQPSILPARGRVFCGRRRHRRLP